MTDSEIDALPAGPEMDRAVAELVGMNHPIAGSPHCSTIDGVALAALEQWAEANDGGWDICRGPTWKTTRHRVRLMMVGKGLEAEGDGDTLALAICRALLKAEGGRKGKET